VASLRAAYPDMRYAIEDVIAAGDKVVGRYRGQATHAGTFGHVAPSDKRVAYTEIKIIHMRDGNLAEAWSEADALGLMRQICSPARST